MNIIGIIAEFDPFHRGHARFLRRLRERFPGAAVVCAMSGPFTQRGGAAVASKYARGEMALGCGADLVLELPVQWAAASAERFARGGAALLAAAGATHIAFGSEAGELAPLRRAAEALDSPGFSERLRPRLRAGLPFASARQRALEELLGTDADVLTRPNNLLGVEYLRAVRALGAELEPVTLRRTGAGHDEAERRDGLSSASALRERLLAGDIAGALAGMPESAAAVLERELRAGRCPAALGCNERGVLTRLRTMDAADFAALPDCGEGLERRMARAAAECAGLEDFYGRVKSKRYAHSRVRRLTLWSYLGLTRGDCPETPPYLRVLALGEAGRAVLRRAGTLGRLPVLTKPAAVKGMDGACRRQFQIDARAQALWELCLPEVCPPRSEWRRGPVMLP